MTIDTVNNDHPSNIAWTSLQPSQAEETQAEEVEETQTPEQIQEDIRNLNNEIAKLIANAAKLLDAGMSMDSDAFKKVYDKIKSLYNDRETKQKALDKATGNTKDPETDPTNDPFYIMSEILDAMEEKDLQAELKDAMKESIEKLNRDVAIALDAIVSAIVGNMSGGGGGTKKISTDDDKDSTSTSTANGLMDLIKQTEESKNKGTDKTEGNTDTGNNVEDTETPKELTDSQPAPDTDSPPNT